MTRSVAEAVQRHVRGWQPMNLIFLTIQTVSKTAFLVHDPPGDLVRLLPGDMAVAPWGDLIRLSAASARTMSEERAVLSGVLPWPSRDRPVLSELLPGLRSLGGDFFPVVENSSSQERLSSKSGEEDPIDFVSRSLSFSARRPLLPVASPPGSVAIALVAVSTRVFHSASLPSTTIGRRSLRSGFKANLFSGLLSTGVDGSDPVPVTTGWARVTMSPVDGFSRPGMSCWCACGRTSFGGLSSVTPTLLGLDRGLLGLPCRLPLFSPLWPDWEPTYSGLINRRRSSWSVLELPLSLLLLDPDLTRDL